MRHAVLFPLTFVLACGGGDADDTDTDVADDTDVDTDTTAPVDTDVEQPVDTAPEDVGTVTTEATEGGIRWADGRAARSCLRYRDGGGRYVGVGTGADASGAYLVDPDGDGGAEPFTVTCDMENDGGGWTLVMQTIPSPGVDTCVADAIGTLEEGTAVTAPAKLADAAITGLWAAGPEREVRIAAHDDSAATTRDAWTRTCVLDHVDDAVWSSTEDPGLRLETGTGTCSDGTWSYRGDLAIQDALEGEGLCGYHHLVDLQPTGGGSSRVAYFILTAGLTEVSGGCDDEGGGRGWGGSGANYGCNVTKVWVR